MSSKSMNEQITGAGISDLFKKKTEEQKLEEKKQKEAKESEKKLQKEQQKEQKAKEKEEKISKETKSLSSQLRGTLGSQIATRSMSSVGSFEQTPDSSSYKLKEDPTKKTCQVLIKSDNAKKLLELMRKKDNEFVRKMQDTFKTVGENVKPPTELNEGDFDLNKYEEYVNQLKVNTNKLEESLKELRKQRSSSVVLVDKNAESQESIEVGVYIGNQQEATEGYIIEYNLAKKSVTIAYNNLSNKRETPTVKIIDLCITDYILEKKNKQVSTEKTEKLEKQDGGRRNAKNAKNNSSSSTTGKEYSIMCE